jgi:hypothetical protein
VLLQGFRHSEFEGVARVLERQLQRSRGGAAVCVYHRGECVVDLWAGTRDRDGRPWERETVAPSFSTTKGHVDARPRARRPRGARLRRPGLAVLAEFAQGGSGTSPSVTLSHGAGLHDIQPRIDHARRMLDWEYMTDVLAARAVAAAGTAERLSRLDVRLARRRAGLRVGGQTGRFLDELLAQPLGLDGPTGRSRRAAPADRTVVLPRLPPSPVRERGASAAGSRASPRAPAPDQPARHRRRDRPHGIRDFDFPPTRRCARAFLAANGTSPRARSRLYAALGAGGELVGARILRRHPSPRDPIERRGFDRVMPFPMHWRPASTAPRRRADAAAGFGHFGFGGSGVFCDPASERAVGLVVNSGVGTPFGDLRILQIGGAAVVAVRRRDGRARAG